MAIKVNGVTVINDDKKAALNVINAGVSSSPPASPNVGDFYYNSNDEKINVWTGSEWK